MAKVLKKNLNEIKHNGWMERRNVKIKNKLNGEKQTKCMCASVYV